MPTWWPPGRLQALPTSLAAAISTGVRVSGSAGPLREPGGACKAAPGKGAVEA
jgi:hypothetical protein